MERLTKCGYQFSLLNVLQGLTRYTEIDEILNQLAAYEDTGLSPADIPALTARAEAAEAERDACKADLQSIVTQSVKDMEKRNWTPPCRYCSKYFVCDYIPEESGCCFEWRGPQEAGEGVTENERKIAQATAGRERLLG